MSNNTLDATFALLKMAPGGERLLQRLRANTYKDFVAVLRLDLDEIITNMERSRERFADQSEDGLTFWIASILKERGYAAANGKQQSGSVDLTVEKPEKAWSWTAEAKIFGSIDKVNEGYLQLSTRYSPGSFVDATAGMLIYVFSEDAASRMRDWHEHLRTTRNVTVASCLSRKQLAFYSTEKHATSGMDFEVRHMAVALHFRPLDKSGRSAAKYKKKTAKASAKSSN